MIYEVLEVQWLMVAKYRYAAKHNLENPWLRRTSTSQADKVALQRRVFVELLVL